MQKRNIFLLAAAVIAAGLLASAGYFWRPIYIEDQGEIIQVRSSALTVGQALHSAGSRLDPLDRVTPDLESPVPFDRKIYIERAVHAYLWENGRVRSVAGLERTPEELLENAGIELSEGDELLWNGQNIPLAEPLPHGVPIVLYMQQAQQVQLVNNGEASQIETTSSTAAEVLWQAGIRISPGDWLSVDPAAPLDEEITIGYEAARPVIIQTVEETITIQSAVVSVGQALAEAGLALQGLDYSLPAEDQPVPQDGTIRLVRVREEVELEENLLPFESQSAPAPELELDQRQTIIPGQYGVQVIRERVRYEDGQEVSRIFDSDWIASEPVAQTVGYGLKIVPKTTDTPDGPIEYYRAVQVYATSYSPCRLGTGKCNHTSASGARLTKGIIAVTLSWYRQLAGHRVYVPGYGFGTISDVGGGIPGRYWIDLGYDDDNYQGTLGWTTMYFLTPAPAVVPWALP
jgi:resuscitation-promoting factor RpfB